MARWARTAWLALLGVGVLTLLVLFVFPTQAYFAQRTELQEARHNVAELEHANAKLANTAKQLDSPAEIERLARERYNMVRPGEQPMTVVPGQP